MSAIFRTKKTEESFGLTFYKLKQYSKVLNVIGYIMAVGFYYSKVVVVHTQIGKYFLSFGP